MTAADEPSLSDLLEQFAPASVLAAGAAADELAQTYCRDHPHCQATVLSPEELTAQVDRLGRFDLALISHTLEYLDRDAAARLIARLRDVHARRLIVILPMGPDWEGHKSHWHKNSMLAYGFVHVGGRTHEGREVHFYAFDIDTYKTTPDWLNARYWANPELFDKYWW